MIAFKDLIRNIPDSKKRKYLGSVYINGLTNYFDAYGAENIELDELMELNIEKVLTSKFFLNDALLFSRPELDAIYSEIGLRKDPPSILLSKELLQYYNVTIDEDFRVPLMDISSTKCEYKLHDYQERIRRKVVNLLFNNESRFLIHMPTGSGKTRTAAEVMLDFIRFSASKALLNEKIKILWIAQSSELCQQAAETVNFIFSKKATQDIKIGQFYDDFTIQDDVLNSSAIIFCGIQKLLLNYEKDIWRQIKNDTYLVIVDEAHRSIAAQWVKALNYFVGDKSVYLLGLTATPGIGSVDNDSNLHLSSYYNNNKISVTNEFYQEIEYPIDYLIERKFLAKIESSTIESRVSVDDNGYEVANSEFVFKEKTLENLATIPSRNLSIINIIKENHKEGKKILVFTCGVEHNRILKSILNNYGIRAETIDAKSKNRNTLINDFKTGDLNVLLNFGVLTTGFDAPKTNVCVIARPISSVVMYSQMVGRILRGELNQGNAVNMLYTIKDNLGHGDYDKLFTTFNKYYIR